MASLLKTALFAALAAAPFVTAQTFSSCNPLTATCPANPGINQGSLITNFTSVKSLPAGWTLVNPGSIAFDNNGANLVLAKQGDSPTIQTDGYMFFGKLTVTMRASGGRGIVSSLILLSDDLDEVDWEFTGTNTAQVQSNYFGKGDTTTYDRAAWHGVTTPQTAWHTYTVNWTPDVLQWSIDGTIVRSLNYADAKGGSRFPQTPMRVRIGIWAGGDPTNNDGTIEWAGGPTNYGAAPFSMAIKNVEIINYSPGKSYTWGDNTGSYESIKIDQGSLMGNTNGQKSVSSATSAAEAKSTSLSIASVPTNNPLTAVPTTTAAHNLTNTLSVALSPTPSPASPGAAQANAAAGLQSTCVGSMIMGALALVMGFAA